MFPLCFRTSAFNVSNSPKDYDIVMPFEKSGQNALLISNRYFQKSCNRQPQNCFCPMHSQQTRTTDPEVPGRDIPLLFCGLSDSSTLDEEEADQRLKPFWPKYLHLFRNRGLYLDTISNVGKDNHVVQLAQYRWRADDVSLYHDPSLPDRLFRGTRKFDKRRFIAKAVHVRSQEHEVISTLWCPSLRDEPMNHVIPILDLITHTQDDSAFIVMEEWSPHIVTRLCCLRQFVSAMHQCIEHIAFMHKHHIAHLDISLQNLVTDCNGRLAFIDYEQSRRFCPSIQLYRIENYRATEVPPELETNIRVDPFKIDIWALGVLILRASKLTGLWIPDLMGIVSPMIDEKPDYRPAASMVLQAFDKLIVCLGDQLGSQCFDSGR